MTKPLTEKQIKNQIAERKKEEDQKRRNIQHASALAKRKELSKRVATRKIDFSQLRTIKVDHKTWIYVNANADVEKIKKQYIRALSKNGYSKIDW